MKATDIIAELGLLDLDDVKRIKSVCDERISSATKNMKYVLSVGDEVIISGGRRSHKHGDRGTIEKVNRTRAVVNIDGARWNVPFGMIQLVDGAYNTRGKL